MKTPQLDASKFAAKDETRPELNGIYQGSKHNGKSYTVATDSFRMLIVEDEANQEGLIPLKDCKAVIKGDIDKVNTTKINYPQWPLIVPKQDTEKEVVVNIDYLYDLAQYLRAHCRGTSRKVTIQVGDQYSPIKLTSKTKDGKEVIALIMPIHK